MQFDIPLQLPPDFTTPSVNVPVNNLNAPGYGAILNMTQITGDFEIFISLDSSLPLSYHHDYHYYHRTGPKNLAGWTERYPVNQSKVIEVYSSGTNLSLLIWYQDGIFRRFNHRDIQISIKTKAPMIDADGIAHDPPQVGFIVSPPEPLTEALFQKFSKQYHQPLSSVPNSPYSPSAPALSPDVTISFVQDSDDDDDFFNQDQSTAMNDTMGQIDNDFDSDFASDDDGNGGGAQDTKTEEIDADFLTDDDEDALNSSNPQSSAVSPGMTLCDNCREEVPNSAFVPHSTQCKQRMAWCEPCQRALPKTMGHTHCNICQIPSTLAYLGAHKRMYHEPVRCECNTHQLQEHVNLGFDAEEFTEISFPYPELAKHFSTCPYREERCQYCSNWFTMALLENHVKQCKNREAVCAYCDVTLTVSKLSTHHVRAHHFDITKPLPDVAAWREENYYKDTSAEQTQYRLPGANVFEDFYQQEQQVERLVLERLQEMGINSLRDADPDVVEDIKRSLFGLGSQ